MLKKVFVSFILLFTFVVSGCSCNKEELIEKSSILKEEIDKLKDDSKKYEGVEEIFDFYNKITTESVNSFVLVESKKNNTTKYSDGVVVGNSGYYYYILTDYNAIRQEINSPLQIVTYRVMDAKANVYDAAIHQKYDSESGLVLLRVDTRVDVNISMKTIDVEDISDLVGHVSSVEHINKVQLTDNIKTSNIEYNNASYLSYTLEDISVNNGVLLNINNKLCGIYLSKYESFISANLIKTIVYSTYQLVL